MSHTPGPWRLGRRSKYRVRIDGYGWESFAKVIVRMDDDEDDCPDGLANARLITAAPELLAALKYYRDECTSNEPSISVFNRMLDEAIAKAEGK